MYKDCRVLMLLLGVPWWNKIIKIVILLLVFYHNYFFHQPFKLKFLLDRHLATNSFGLGRLFLQIKSPASKF